MLGRTRWVVEAEEGCECTGPPPSSLSPHGCSSHGEGEEAMDSHPTNAPLLTKEGRGRVRAPGSRDDHVGTSRCCMQHETVRFAEEHVFVSACVSGDKQAPPIVRGPFAPECHSVLAGAAPWPLGSGCLASPLADWVPSGK